MQVQCLTETKGELILSTVGSVTYCLYLVGRFMVAMTMDQYWEPVSVNVTMSEPESEAFDGETPDLEVQAFNEPGMPLKHIILCRSTQLSPK